MVPGKAILALLKTTASCWSERNAPRLGAALAFYMLLSMAPLLILVVAICGLVFSESSAQQQVLAQVRAISGAAGEKTVAMLIASAHRPKTGIIATIFAFITLLSGASGVFLELRDSLNVIWDAGKRGAASWRSMIWQRVVSFGMVLALGFLLLVSLILSAAVTIVENFFVGLVPLHFTIAGQVANLTISLVAMAALFTLIYKFVPDVPIAWRDVGIGAVVTAIFFAIGKALLGLYFRTVGVGSTYGAAGSLVALVIWVYYSAQIFFFGAMFTRVYADKYGSLAAKAGHENDLPRPSLAAKTQRA
jgi:membrane protein